MVWPLGPLEIDVAPLLSTMHWLNVSSWTRPPSFTLMKVPHCSIEHSDIDHSFSFNASNGLELVSSDKLQAISSASDELGDGL
mmetsp:Transcript_12048/g.28173  ORF Transcript_12048/g.28173 Transcript_12048/m.28173 type:complete len:83 (+) Transcript_12048:116-364(+)